LIDAIKPGSINYELVQHGSAESNLANAKQTLKTLTLLPATLPWLMMKTTIPHNGPYCAITSSASASQLGPAVSAERRLLRQQRTTRERSGCRVLTAAAVLHSRPVQK